MTQMLEYVVTKKNLIEGPLAPDFVTISQNLHHQTFKKKKSLIFQSNLRQLHPLMKPVS